MHMAVTQYIGARYVPIFADPAEWSNQKSYEPLTIVLHQGNSYTSKQYVPVGIDIADETYWAETGNYNAQVEQYRRDVQFYINKTNMFSYPTMEEVMADEQNVRTNTFVQTNGYHEVNDGGNGLYFVTNAAVVDASVEIAANKYATLISDGGVNVVQIGATRDSDLAPYITKIANSIPLYYRCFIPAGDWYCSELVLNTQEYFELYGVESFHTIGSNCTCLHPIASGQDYIIKLGGSSTYNEASIAFTNRCIHAYLHDLVFYSVDMDGVSNVFDNGAGLVLSLCLYSTFERINFTGCAGTCMSLCDVWECVFGTIIIRSCPGPQYKIVALPQKSVTGTTVSPNVSSCEFKLIHAESNDGGVLQVQVGCAFANNHIGTIIYEGGVYHADESIAWTEEAAADANRQYILDIVGENDVIDNIILTYPYVRSNIRTYGEEKYYLDAMIHTNTVSDSSSYRGICNFTIGNVMVSQHGNNFVLYRSDNFLRNDGFACCMTFGTVVLENNQSSAQLLVVEDGCIPVIGTFVSRNTQRVCLGNLNKEIGTNFSHRGSVVNVGGTWYAARMIPNNNSLGQVNTLRTFDTMKIAVYNFDAEANHSLTARIYTDETNYRTVSLSCEPGLSVVSLDVSSDLANLRVIFLNPSYQLGICDIGW